MLLIGQFSPEVKARSHGLGISLEFGSGAEKVFHSQEPILSNARLLHVYGRARRGKLRRRHPEDMLNDKSQVRPRCTQPSYESRGKPF